VVEYWISYCDITGSNLSHGNMHQGAFSLILPSIWGQLLWVEAYFSGYRGNSAGDLSTKQRDTMPSHKVRRLWHVFEEVWFTIHVSTWGPTK